MALRELITAFHRRRRSLAATSLAAIALIAASANADLTLRLEDYAAAPITGTVDYPSSTANSGYLARLNFMAEDPTSANRLFVNDLNGTLSVLDRTTRQFSPYLDFNGRGAATGIFPRLYTSAGFATGLVSFQFDPDYANNGKFYTIHVEQGGASQLPDSSGTPGFNATGYTTTASINAPGFGGTNGYQDVLVEWTDANPADAAFQGTARELLRIGQRDRIHPMGDIIFNPNAGPGDADWRTMYVSIGDGGAGETASIRTTPQQLDNLAGKIIRIRPDAVGATTTLTASDNGRYFVPNDNPFTGVASTAVRDEIFALGLRNPHRLTWDGPSNTLIASDIGLHSWEELNVVHPGGDYGYSVREGNQQLDAGYHRVALPASDLVTYFIDATTPAGTTTPIYPVVQYGHGSSGQPDPVGDAISSGFVYRGTAIPSLAGKFVFGDITTGQLLWADYADMQAADDGNPATMAAIHSIDILWDDPAAAGGEQLFTVTTPSGATLGPMHQIVDAAYHARGGLDPNLPGGAAATGSFGRADIRLQLDAAGELYILSKSDGMVRKLVAAVGVADFNGDAAVSGSDFLAWQRGFGTLGGQILGDADGDGFVTAADLGFWKSQLGRMSVVAAVPEPKLAAALVFMRVVCRRRDPSAARSRRRSTRPC